MKTPQLLIFKKYIATKCAINIKNQDSKQQHPNKIKHLGQNTPPETVRLAKKLNKLDKHVLYLLVIRMFFEIPKHKKNYLKKCYKING